MVTSFLFFFKHKNKMQCFGLVLLAGAVSEAPSECVQVCDVLASVSWACATMPGSGSGLSVQRCLTFTTGLVECLCFAGAVFGWASLVFVLKEEGYFSSLCVNGTGVNGTHVLGQCDVLTFTTLSNKINLKMAEGWKLINHLFLRSFLTFVSADCAGQDEQFSLIFTIASFMNNFLTLPNGFLFDRFGTTVTRLYGM